MNARSIALSAIAVALAAPAPAFAGLVAAEYFFDTDPGQGNGTTIEIVNSPADAAVLGEIPSSVIAALPPGVHTFACRIQNDDGHWSHAFSRPFLKKNAPPPPISPVAGAEFFIDTDPGQGQGVSVPITNVSGPDSFVAEIPAPILAALPEGTHTVGVRIRNADGGWSVSYARPFFRDAAAEAIALVDGFEAQWYRNNAPIGSPVFTRGPAPALELSLTPAIPTDALDSDALYQLVVVPLDTLGRRGIASTRSVFVDPIITLSSARLLPNGAFQLTLEGPPALSVTIETSIDLEEWTPLPSAVPASGNFEFTPNGEAETARFFKVVAR